MKLAANGVGDAVSAAIVSKFTFGKLFVVSLKRLSYVKQRASANETACCEATWLDDSPDKSYAITGPKVWGSSELRFVREE